MAKVVAPLSMRALALVGHEVVELRVQVRKKDEGVLVFIAFRRKEMSGLSGISVL